MVKDDQITIIIFSINHIIVWLQWQKFHSMDDPHSEMAWKPNESKG